MLLAALIIIIIIIIIIRFKLIPTVWQYFRICVCYMCTFSRRSTVDQTDEQKCRSRCRDTENQHYYV